MSRQAYVMETLFNIYNKEGVLVPFKLNNIQKQLDKQIIEGNIHRASVLKYRQGGVTTFIQAWFLIECMARHTIAVMLAHDRDHTEKLLERMRQMLVNLNGPAPRTSKVNDNEISFAKTQSTFYIGTAGSKNFGRSATISHLHCSEVAFWRDPKTILTGLLQAVPHRSGVVVQETTGNGWGNYYQKSFYSMLSGNSRFKPFFFPWFIHNEYVSPDSLTSPLTLEEKELQIKFSLSLPQIQWRREKVTEFENDEDLFKQEYPSSIDEAFKLTGGSLFSQLERSEDSKWIRINSEVKKLSSHPKIGLNYIFGVDSSGGTGNDYSSIVGLCIETQGQVFEYHNNHIAPPKFARVVGEYGKQFNSAYLVPESNSHGLSVLSTLKDIYPREKIYKHRLPTRKLTQGAYNVPGYGYGWQTTGTTKPYAVGLAQSLVLEGWKVYSPELYDELRSFVETIEGRLEGVGTHDDLAMAFILASVGVTKILNRLGREQKVIPTKISPPDPSHWRDEQGRFQLPFKDMFKKRSIHTRA